MTQRVTKPIALDKSFNTTGSNPQNIADTLADKLDAIKSAIENGGSGEMEAAFECHYNVTSATDIYNAMQEKKVPFFYSNGVVAQLWKVETNKYTFRTTSTRVVEGENILDIVDYIVNGSVWSTAAKTIPGGVYPEDVKLLKIYRNYAETEYDPLANSDTSVYIPTVEKHSHDNASIVDAITRVLAAGGSPIITKLGTEFIYASGTAFEYKFVNISGDNITEMTIDRSTGTVTTRNCLLDSSEVEAGDSSISVQKTVDPDTGAETFTVSVADEGITNDKIPDATIEPEKLARKKQISVDGITIVATPVSDDEVQLSAVIPEALVIPDDTVIYDGQTATETVPCEDGTIYSLDFDAASLSSVTLDLDIAAAEPVNGPPKHCYIRVRNTGSACASYTISYYTPDGTACAVNWTISPGNKYVYDVLARKSSAGTLAIVSLIGEG